MKRIEAFAEYLYEEKIRNEFDRIIPIVADESMGKSTFILQWMVIWRRITDRPIDIDEMLDQLIYDRTGFKAAMVNYPARTVVPVPDAARVFHKKEALDSDQVELEKDVLDVRAKENVFLLGYQDWDVVPTFLQRRRAKNVLRIPTRGTIWGYNRESLDEKYETGDWPAPDLKDSFPSLEGTDLWRRYKKLDMEKKKDRISASLEEEKVGDGKSLKELKEEIKRENLDAVIGHHGGWNRDYIDADLIEMEYELSARDAKKVKKLLDSDPDVQVGGEKA